MPIIGTELYVLSIPGATFLKIPPQRKVMLRLYLNKEDQFTLAAWVGNDIDYDSHEPLHILKVDVLSGYKLKADYLFGDQKIDNDTIGKVQLALGKNPKNYVYLKPTDDITYHNQVAYEILVGDKFSAHLTITSFGQTKPSPPYSSKI